MRLACLRTIALAAGSAIAAVGSGVSIYLAKQLQNTCVSVAAFVGQMLQTKLGSYSISIVVQLEQLLATNQAMITQLKQVLVDLPANATVVVPVKMNSVTYSLAELFDGKVIELISQYTPGASSFTIPETILQANVDLGRVISFGASVVDKVTTSLGDSITFPLEINIPYTIGQLIPDSIQAAINQLLELLPSICLDVPMAAGIILSFMVGALVMVSIYGCCHRHPAIPPYQPLLPS